MELYPILAEKDKLDTSGDFPVVRGVCLYHKRDDWREGRNNPEQDNLDEIKTPITYIILYSDLDKLRRTLSTIRQESHVVIALEQGPDIKIQPIFSLLRDEFQMKSYNIVGSHTHDDFEHMFKEAFKRVKNGYATIVNDGFSVPSDWESKLNHYVNYRRNIVLGITPIDDINGLTVYSSVFRLLKQNRDGHFFQKLIDEGGQDYIKNWNEL
jgi:hypothetical protein